MFIQIKISNTRSKVKLIQIIDVSERVLNNRMRSQHMLLTLINATVSHELRNPLNSLVGQIFLMSGQLESMDKILF